MVTDLPTDAGYRVAWGIMAKNGRSLYVQEMGAPFHGIMHQKKFGGLPMSGRWRRHPPLNKMVVMEQILLFKVILTSKLGHFALEK